MEECYSSYSAYFKMGCSFVNCKLTGSFLCQIGYGTLNKLIEILNYFVMIQFVFHCVVYRIFCENTD